MFDAGTVGVTLGSPEGVDAPTGVSDGVAEKVTIGVGLMVGVPVATGVLD